MFADCKVQTDKTRGTCVHDARNTHARARALRHHTHTMYTYTMRHNFSTKRTKKDPRRRTLHELHVGDVWCFTVPAFPQIHLTPDAVVFDNNSGGRQLYDAGGEKKTHIAHTARRHVAAAMKPPSLLLPPPYMAISCRQRPTTHRAHTEPHKRKPQSRRWPFSRPAITWRDFSNF